MVSSKWLNDEDFMDLLEFGSNDDVFRAYAANQLTHPDMPYRVYMARKPLIEVIINYRVAISEMSPASVREKSYVTKRDLMYDEVIGYSEGPSVQSTYYPARAPHGDELIEQFKATGRITVPLRDGSGDEETIDAYILTVSTPKASYRNRMTFNESFEDMKENMKFMIHQYQSEVTI